LKEQSHGLPRSVTVIGNFYFLFFYFILFGECLVYFKRLGNFYQVAIITFPEPLIKKNLSDIEEKWQKKTKKRGDLCPFIFFFFLFYPPL